MIANFHQALAALLFLLASGFMLMPLLSPFFVDNLKIDVEQLPLRVLHELMRLPTALGDAKIVHITGTKPLTIDAAGQPRTLSRSESSRA